MAKFIGVLKSYRESNPGYDEITYSMIKNSHHTIVQFILRLFNYVFGNEIFPEQWETSIIIPIDKVGKYSNLLTNYRTIALTIAVYANALRK